MRSTSSPLTVRIYQAVARISAWTLLIISGVSGLVLFFLVSRPDDVAWLPQLSELAAEHSINLTQVVLLCGFMSLVGSIICFVVAPLQAVHYQQVEHDYMMREVERMVPVAVRILQEDIGERCARLTIFSRLAKKVETEAPKLHREMVELVAMIACLSYNEIRPLDAKTAELIGLIDDHEDALAAAVDTLGHCRKQLPSLIARVRKTTSDHGDTSIQVRYLLTEIDALRAQLLSLQPSNNIHPIRPDVRPAE